MIPGREKKGNGFLDEQDHEVVVFLVCAVATAPVPASVSPSSVDTVPFSDVVAI